VTEGLERAGTALRDRGSGLGVQLQAIARALRPLGGPGAREAFVHTLRAVIDARGQRVGAADRLYLLEAVPTLIAWGERDRTIPIEHGRAAHAAVPHSRFVELAGAAHFPHLEAPEALADALLDWIAVTEPASLDDDAWRALLRRRASARPRAA
jgi:pimeloyl-ACP methyl ester carboxylesterase